MITYERSFLKLFDVFAYIGGLIQLVFVFFFFMTGFGRLLNEMKMAQTMFRTKEGTDGVNFISYIKQSIFTFLAATCCRPEW